MNNVRLLLSSLLIILTCTGFLCEDEDSAVTPKGGGTANGLSASSSGVTMLTGDDATVIISMGTLPYTVSQNSNPSVVQAAVNGGTLTLNSGSGTGSASVTVSDASSPAKSVTILVNVQLTISLTSSGSVSFSAPSSDFAASGILSISNEAFPSGQGAGALKSFDVTTVLAYKEYSPTRMDLFEADFFYNTSTITGTYSYPGSGNRVEIYYFKDANPSDTTVRPKVYLFTGASAEIATMNTTHLTGTFSGTATNYFNNTDKMSVTNGVFAVPFRVIGGNESKAAERVALTKRLKERFLRKQ
jgi:hypothetical protein